MEKSKVYFIKKITPENLIKIYEALGINLDGKVGVKVSTGEAGSRGYLKANLIGPLVKRLNGTIIECNTAYPGKRNTVEDHMKVAEEHGFTSFADVDISKENPMIHIKINLRAKTLTGQDSLDYSNTDILTKLNGSLKDYLSSQITDYLYKTSKEYKTDINEFFRIARRKFKTIPDFENYNWAQKYENAEFHVEINSDIISSLLIQNS